MNSRYKNPIFIVILALIFIVAGILLFRNTDDTEDYVDNDDSSAVTAEEGEIEVKGTIACLPFSINVSGQECVKGVKGDDGKMYALNSIKVNGIESTMAEGTKVTVIGVYEPANTSIDDSSSFKYDGVLVVRSLKKR